MTHNYDDDDHADDDEDYNDNDGKGDDDDRCTWRHIFQRAVLLIMKL